jgi:outer membrane lipoprotein carrier protein
VRDFSAGFVHTYEGGVLRKKVTESGSVMVKKPGKMRWTYTKPEEKLFVSDGVKIYSYLPADKQVIVNTMPPADQASTPILFLVGKGQLTRDFVVSYADGAAGDVYALKLVPRRPEAEYESIVLLVDRATLKLRGLVSADRQGGQSGFTFTNLKENVGMADKLFTFTIPRGVDVVSGGPAPG